MAGRRGPHDLMALVVGWYDFVCFGIIAGAFVGALWIIYENEGGGVDDKGGGDGTMYETLLIVAPEVGEGGGGGGGGGTSTTGTTRKGKKGHVRSFQLWRSCWRGLHPVWLLGLRLLSFLIMAALLTWDVLKWDTSIFIYYTEWTFALVMLYFAIGTVMSAYGCWEYSKRPPNETRNSLLRGDLEEYKSTHNASVKVKDYSSSTVELQGHRDREEIKQIAGFWGYLMQILYQTCAGAVILTDLVFWCVIVPFLSNTHLGLNLLMGCIHTLNAVFLLLDASVNSLPFPWFRLAYFVLWSCLYVAFQWIIHACGFQWWPYPFLELSTPWAPLWYFCLALAHIPCYGIYALLIKAKISIFSSLFPHAFVEH